MLKIGICDDIEWYVKQLHIFLDEYDFGEEVEIVEFSDGIKMINDISKLDADEIFDLIITDIEFTKRKEINAVELFKKIQLQHPNMKIIYFTAHDEYVDIVANSWAFGYIRKPLKREKILELFDRYKLLERSELTAAPAFVCRYKGQMMRVPYGLIKYIYSNQRKVIIVQKNGNEVELRAKLDDIWEKNFSLLEYFVRVNKSYILNMHYVNSFSAKEVSVEGGLTIGVRPHYLDEYRKRYNAFLFGNYPSSE